MFVQYTVLYIQFSWVLTQVLESYLYQGAVLYTLIFNNNLPDGHTFSKFS